MASSDPAPVFGLVCVLPDGTKLPASVANNSTGHELLELLGRCEADGWNFTHAAIPPVLEPELGLLRAAELEGDQLQVADLSQCFRVQAHMDRLNSQELHGAHEDALEDKYLWGANKEAVEYRRKKKEAEQGQ